MAKGVTDELYAVPLDKFMAARDGLAARLKAAGDKDAAVQVKRARKPSVPAWASNQVVRQARDQWERLRRTVHATRRNLEKRGSAEELRQASREQREALQACEARAAQLLTQQGHTASPALLQKVGHTLLALAYGAPGVTPGRLDRELPPPGFEALAGLTAAPVPKAQRSEAVIRKTSADKTSHSRQRAALKASKARHAEARRLLLKARARLTAENARRDNLERQLEAASRAGDQARRQLKAAEAEVAAADAALRQLRAEAVEG